MELDDHVVAAVKDLGTKAKAGDRLGVEAILAKVKDLKAQGASNELVDPLIQMMEAYLAKTASRNAAAAGRRKMSRKYCKKTACKKMGFTQRASCRPYKNCFTRKQGRSRY
jgi:hypothetical protein